MGYETNEFNAEHEAGPSWANPNWPALDPTQMEVAVKAAAAKAGAPIDESAVKQAAADAIKAMLIIRTYRVRGHLAANLDPLGLSNRQLPDDLKSDFFD